ncbi:MAG: hybrid sensor histidine kinase/response regulator, partial [Cyanobacteria bacterium J06560_2]
DSQIDEPSSLPDLAVQALPVAGPSAIEDDELREAYRVVSAERLQKLELGLVQLETQPDSPDALAELLREAHSLKGDARSVGLAHVGSLAHALESILVSIQNKSVVLAGELADLLYQGLDAIAQRIDEAITGIPADHSAGSSNSRTVDTEQLLIQLREISPILTDTSEQADLSATLLSAAERSAADFSSESDRRLLLSPDALPTGASPSSARQSVAEPYKIETIRVDTRNLDTLAAQAEQLTLTRIQTAQTTAKMLDLVNLWGQWRTFRNTNPSQLQAEPNPYEAPLDALISKLRIATQENSFRLDLISQDMVSQVQALRLLPINSVLRIFPRVVRDLARQQSKSVELITEGGETTADKRILEEIQDSLMHLVRNALDHGIETPEEREAAGKPATAKLWIRSYQSPNSIVIEVADDGRGLDIEQIKQTAIRRKLYSSDQLQDFSDQQVQDLVFVPGFSTRSFTTEISGRGVGLDVVLNQIERLKGNVQIESTPGQGSTFRLQISTQLATANVVFIKVRGITHALPIEFLQTTMRISRDDITAVDGRDTISWNERTIPVIDLFDVLELANSPAYLPPTDPIPDDQKACLLLKVGDEMGAFLVDRLLDTQEVVFKPQSVLLKRIRNVTGSTILGNGEICTILNPPDLVKSIQRRNEGVAFAPPEETPVRKSLILLVEDSPPVRIQEKRLFENAGYEVVTAENGLEGYEILRGGNFDAVVSDIEMPELDGLGLVIKIREHAEYEELPIVLVTTLSSEEDRQKGADAGANAYIVKGKFNQEVLLETLGRLI